MSFSAYPGYKDSEVEWLGSVPDDWVVRKVSVDFSATKGPRGALLTKEYCHENSGEYPVYSGQTVEADAELTHVPTQDCPTSISAQTLCRQCFSRTQTGSVTSRKLGQFGVSANTPAFIPLRRDC